MNTNNNSLTKLKGKGWQEQKKRHKKKGNSRCPFKYNN